MTSGGGQKKRDGVNKMKKEKAPTAGKATRGRGVLEEAPVYYLNKSDQKINRLREQVFVLLCYMLLGIGVGGTILIGMFLFNGLAAIFGA